MIGKIEKGTSFAGALRYDIEKEGAQVLDSNLANTDSWNDMASEMDAVADCNSRCKNRCLHLSFSAAPSEKLTEEQWRQGTQSALRELGLEGHQYVVTRHTDGAHDHVHIVVNRVGPDGKAGNDSNDRHQVHAASRVMEKELGLQRANSRTPSRDGRFEQTRADLNAAVKAAGNRGLDGFKSEMKQRGYTVIENRSQTTGKLSGLSVKSDKDGKTWKASELRKGGARSITAQLDAQQKQQLTQRAQHAAAAAGRAAGQAAAKAISGGLSLPRMPGIPGTGGLAGAIIKAASAKPAKRKER